MATKTTEILRKQFGAVSTEIRSIKNKVHEGGMFFHTYTIEELRGMKEHIYKRTEVLGNDMKNWKEHDQLIQEDIDTYNSLKADVDTQCWHLEREIKERKPTFMEWLWEELSALFEGFADQVKANLPEIVLSIIVRSPKLVWIRRVLPRLLGRKT